MTFDSICQTVSRSSDTPIVTFFSIYISILSKNGVVCKNWLPKGVSTSSTNCYKLVVYPPNSKNTVSRHNVLYQLRAPHPPVVCVWACVCMRVSRGGACTSCHQLTWIETKPPMLPTLIFSPHKFWCTFF